MHLSQPIGAGAFDGQHGMSPAISSVASAADISSVMTCIGASGDICAMTGRETGANARPATTRIASSRRMVKLRFTNPDSHKIAANERLQPLHGVEIPVTVTDPLGLYIATVGHVHNHAARLSIELRSSWRFPPALRK